MDKDEIIETLVKSFSLTRRSRLSNDKENNHKNADLFDQTMSLLKEKIGDVYWIIREDKQGFKVIDLTRIGNIVVSQGSFLFVNELMFSIYKYLD